MPTPGDDDVPTRADGPVGTPGGSAPVGPSATGASAKGNVVADVSTGTAGEPFADQTAAASDARRLLWPWVARRTRTQVIALVLVSLLALGPAFALGTILRSDPTPVNTLSEAPPTDPDVTRIMVTATRMSPTAGEMQARITIKPSDDLLDDAGRLNEPVSVSVNGAQEGTTRTFPAGETTSIFEVSLPLKDGNTSRYPFDNYRGSAIVVVTIESGGKRVAVPSTIEAQSIVTDFNLSGQPSAEFDPAGQQISEVELEATRPATTTVYAVWLMILMWGLAVTGLLLVWAVVIWMVDLPFWAVGYLVGVLFALPQLRDSLPGRPPPGTIFDYGSFYWSVTLIGVNLILVLVVWLRRVQSESQLRSMNAAREEQAAAEAADEVAPTAGPRNPGEPF